MQFGSGWWFLDQKDGMEKQINALSNMGVVSTFIGMLTDSRSFLSYSRHEYFRRIICNLFAQDMEKGLIPNAAKMATMANLSFKEGQISYIEWSNAMSQVQQIQMQALESLALFNLNQSTLYYLLSK